jgi:NAD(P)-dependent dehydrogenase (short-subunit alcohol dehydrogenase family)
MATPLAGKVLLIVGASAGIGADAARVLAGDGAALMLVARRAGPLAEVAAELREAGHDVAYTVGDVSKAADVAGFVDATVERFGRLDGALNNAATTQSGRLDEVSEPDFDQIMAVNVKGTWLCIREQVRVMRAQRSGSIVTVSSIGGLRGSSGMGAYQATKHAVIGLTRTAAHDFGPWGIRVNAIAPGPTDTAATRTQAGEAAKDLVKGLALKRMGQPEDMVGACLFLLSDEASWVTGQIVNVDGGQVFR